MSPFPPAFCPWGRDQVPGLPQAGKDSRGSVVGQGDPCVAGSLREHPPTAAPRAMANDHLQLRAAIRFEPRLQGSCSSTAMRGFTGHYTLLGGAGRCALTKARGSWRVPQPGAMLQNNVPSSPWTALMGHSASCWQSLTDIIPRQSPITDSAYVSWLLAWCSLTGWASPRP